jgi:hypothetical protein
MSTITPIPAGDLLREMLMPGDRVLVLVTKLNTNGDKRWMRVIANVNDVPLDITSYVARLLGEKDTLAGIPVKGLGMDMRVHLLCNLSRGLYGPGEDYALKMA